MKGARPKRAGKRLLVARTRVHLELRRILSANLKRARAHVGFTQEGAAEEADFSLQYFQRIERGIVNVPLDTIARLAAALRVAPHELLAPPS